MKVMSDELKALVKTNKAKSSGTLRGYKNGERFLNSQSVHYLRAEEHDIIIGSEQQGENFEQSWVVVLLPNDLDENEPEHVVDLHHEGARWGFQIRNEYYQATEGKVTFSYKAGKRGVSGIFELSSGNMEVDGYFNIWNK